MTALDTSLDRLNFFNGQRLEASDFRAEQAYHIAVRRWLNRSLYSPGIASGLEVTAHPTDMHKVVVAPGLAIDSQGREIILLESREVMARGAPTGSDGLVFGNYLVISYYEARAGASEDGCSVNPAGSLCAPSKGGCACGGRCGCAGGSSCTCASGKCKGSAGDAGLIWGGMTRIRADPVLDFQNAWPTRASGKIVLAQIDLDAQCKVREVLTGMRQYTSGTQPPKVRAVSLEGEKDIDHDNPKVLFFQVEGANPQRVTLHLWGTKFSSLYYTEMGHHTHGVLGNTDAVAQDFTHKHGITNGKTDAAGAHQHDYLCDDADDVDLRVFATADPPAANRVFSVAAHAGDKAAGFTSEPGILPVPDHTHTLALENALGPTSHAHPVNFTSQSTGTTDIAAHTGTKALQYLSGVTIELDGTDITALILAYLNGLSPGDWTQLGDGTATHALASSAGTGGIELKSLGIEFPLGAHKLVFSVPANAGGQLHYNLYVE